MHTGLHALAFVIKRNHLSFIFSAACGIIIFRSELAIIMGCYLISELMTKLRIVDAIKYSIPAGLLWICKLLNLKKIAIHIHNFFYNIKDIYISYVNISYFFLPLL